MYEVVILIVIRSILSGWDGKPQVVEKIICLRCVLDVFAGGLAEVFWYYKSRGDKDYFCQKSDQF